jgi:FO synthase
LFRKGNARAGSSFEENLIVHALARLLLNSTIPNVQVSWVKLGFPGALACLQAGANDFSGTLMEESISKAAGADYGESVSPGELRAMIRSIGRIPAERYTTYGIRRLFPEPEGDEFIPVDRMPAPVGHVPLAVGY